MTRTKQKGKSQVEPNLKMVKTFNALSESKSLSEAMIKGGYSEMTARIPKQMTESEGWKKLLEKDLPDNMLTEALQDDIRKKPGKRTEELKLAFKIKGKYQDNQTNIVIQSEPINEVIMIVPQGREGNTTI